MNCLICMFNQCQNYIDYRTNIRKNKHIQKMKNSTINVTNDNIINVSSKRAATHSKV